MILLLWKLQHRFIILRALSSLTDAESIYQVISLLNLLLFQTNRIHPSYIDCVRPLSQAPTFLWPEIPYPPKKY
jgi:hypothetical protein